MVGDLASRKAGKTHEEARQESHEAILRAGAELLMDEAYRNPFAGLRVQAICQQAGYTTGAFYTHWADADAYYQALGEYLLSDEPYVFFEEFETLRSVARTTQGLPPRPAVVQLAEADFESLSKNVLWDAVELLNLTWARTRLREAAIRGYRDVDKLTAETYSVVLENQGREARPPFTMTHLGTLLQALIEGLSLRHRVDPDAVASVETDPMGLYATSVAALLAILTRKQGDTTTVEEALDGAFGS